MKRIVIGLLLTLLLFIGGIIAYRYIGSKSSEEPVAISFFFANVCESCEEEEEFVKIIRQELLPIADTISYEYHIYNIMKTYGNEVFQNMVEKLELDITSFDCPLMLVGDTVVKGYDTIQKDIKTVVTSYANTNTYNKLTNNKEFKDTMLLLEEDIVFFTTLACTQCESVKTRIEEERFPINMKELNITDGEYANTLLAYFNAYKVTEQEQQVPIIFWNDNYASGYEEINEVFSRKQWWMEGNSSWTPTYEEESFPNNVDIWKLIGIGVLNGLNPCALSMLLFLSSILLSMEVKTGRIGCAYLGGKLIAYFLMGIGFFSILQIAETSILNIYQFVKIGIIIIMIIIGILNFIDFTFCLKKEYGKVRMQLPKGFRKFNHNIMKKIEGIKGVGLVWIVFLLGVIVSVGEFFCTGQIYAATLLLLLKTGIGNSLYIYGAIAIYVIALCIPSACILGIIIQTKSIWKASDKTLTMMPVIKLANCIMFIVFAYLFYII